MMTTEALCDEGERLLSGPVTRAALSRWEERTMSPHKLAPDPALRTRLLGLRSRARRLLRSDADPLVPESVDWSAPARLRARVQALCEEGEALLARGAVTRAELGRWNIHQQGFSSRIRGVDPALATRLRALSVKFRAGQVTPEPAVVAAAAPTVSAPTCCTHCPTHCPAS